MKEISGTDSSTNTLACYAQFLQPTKNFNLILIVLTFQIYFLTTKTVHSWHKFFFSGKINFLMYSDNLINIHSHFWCKVAGSKFLLNVDKHLPGYRLLMSWKITDTIFSITLMVQDLFKRKKSKTNIISPSKCKAKS